MTDSDLCFAGVLGQLDLLRSGRVTSVELVTAHLDRIERLDGDLNAFRLVFADAALREAADADERRAAGEDAPLLGVPIAVKEETDLAGLPTTFGTDAVTRIAQRDAETVARLRRAGAVIIGRTRASELCLWPFTQTESAGPTRNPWSREHSPGGSSGGSAAAVAAGFAAAALGSDSGGSIRMPSAATGLFGLKPQRGRVSLAPHAEFWAGLAVTGPITRTVADAAALLDVLHGPADGDRHAARSPSGPFAASVDRPATLRIGLSLRPWPVGGTLDPAVRDAVLATARLLTELGHVVVPVEPPQADPTGMLSYAPLHLGSLADTVAAIDRPEALSRRTRTLAAVGRRIPRSVRAAARRRGERMEVAVNRVFDQVDVLLSPVTPRRALRVGELFDASWLATLLGAQKYTSYLTLWNVVGNPAASVPAGLGPDGLPIGVQLIGRPHAEETVLGLAAQLERARPWSDRPPSFA
ncbi:amidase [Umezawaea sp. NPDC059074]|uniref:amidase n=1 Tax=Umezawaea sp. NPDC059074 TaxID=3346716 RepID=UPI0036880664